MVGSCQRLFVAFEVPAAIRRSLSHTTGVLRHEFDGLRVVAEADLHITVVFLGEVASDMVPSIVERLCTRVPSTGLPLTIRGLGSFPESGSPRVLWAGVEDPTGRARALQSELQESLRCMLPHLEGGPWCPHVTLGRPARDARCPGLRGRLEVVGRSVGPWTYEAHDVVLFQSPADVQSAAPAASRYRVLWRAALDG